MKISTRGRYALRVMIDLAEHNSGEFIPLSDIADRQEISEKYLESIIGILSKSAIVSGRRGKGGGYRLSRSPELYTVGEILRLTEGSLSPVSCVDGEFCKREENCKTFSMWKGLARVINEYLDGITIADLCGGSDGFDYII